MNAPLDQKVRKASRTNLPEPWKRFYLRSSFLASAGRVTENGQPAYSLEEIAKWIHEELADAYLSGVLHGARGSKP
jgi:hypothetical protein